MLKRIKRKVLSYFNTPIGYVFMLHRVFPFEDEKLFPNENMKVTPEFLENFIVKNLEKYVFVSLDEIVEIINRKQKVSKPFVCFTFDDGYADNYNYAFPIFKKYNIPFAIYVSTGLIEHTSKLWWYQMENIILQNDKIELSNGSQFICKTKKEKENVFLQIRKLVLELPTEDFENHFNHLFSNYSSNLNYDNLMMNWAQIKELSDSDICTISAHTVTHRRLSELNNNELIYDVVESKNILEQKTGKSVNHFAYPFGTSFEVSPLVVDILRSSSFHSSTFANGGAIRKYDKDLFRIKRIMLTENYEDTLFK